MSERATAASTANWEALVKILRMQEGVYGELHALLKKKERMIVENRMDDLKALIEEEERTIGRVDALEEERVEVAQMAARDAGLKGRPGLEGLLNAAPRIVAEDLKAAALAMMKTLDQVATLNRSNAELIDQSMKFIDFNLNLLADGPRQDDIYGEKGTIRDQAVPPRSLWNEKA